MKLTSLAAALAVSVFGVSAANAGLLTNGSFEEEIFDGAGTTLLPGVTISDTSPALTNANDNGNAGNAGLRLASTSTTATIVFPGWTFETTGSFSGLNFTGSTPADTGFTSVVSNSGGIVNATSDSFALDPLGGELLRVSGAFNQHDGDVGSGSDYSFSVLFDTGDVAVLADQAIFLTALDVAPGTIGPADVDSFFYSEQISQEIPIPAGATSAQVIFQLDPNGGGQLGADSFSVVQIPEPTSVVLAMIGLVGAVARRRRV